MQAACCSESVVVTYIIRYIFKKPGALPITNIKAQSGFFFPLHEC